MVIAAKKNQFIAFHLTLNLTLPLISGNSTNQKCLKMFYGDPHNFGATAITRWL
jgi:hypothetical protein